MHVLSDIDLPCEAQSHEPSAALQQCMFYHSPDSLCEFAQVRWAGRHGGDAIRAYDTGNGLLVCAYDKVKMLTEKHGRSLTFDFSREDSTAAALAGALAINLGMSLGTLLSDDLALHGAGVEIDGKFVALMALSGTGKSTLLWALLDSGARFANDDMIPVKVQAGSVVAYPSVSLPSKLSRKALADRRWRPESFTPVFPDADEFWIPIPPDRRLLEPRPLSALFILQPFRQLELPGLIHADRLEGPAAIPLLMANIQGLWAAHSLLDGAQIMDQYLALAQTVPVYILSYLRRYDMLNPLIDVISDLVRSPLIMNQEAKETITESRPTWIDKLLGRPRRAR